MASDVYGIRTSPFTHSCLLVGIMCLRSFQPKVEERQPPRAVTLSNLEYLEVTRSVWNLSCKTLENKGARSWHL